MRTLATIVLVAFSLVSFTPRAQAQTQTPHTASQSALDAALQQHVASADAERQAILRLLDRPEVQQVAGDTGLDLKTARTAVATLQGDQLAAVAAQASQVEQSLAGGQSRVVISTTLIIVALLVLILIIVAVD
jgi:hypothetical protein